MRSKLLCTGLLLCMLTACAQAPAPVTENADVSETDDGIEYNVVTEELGWFIADAFDAQEMTGITAKDGHKLLCISIVVSAFKQPETPLNIGDWYLTCDGTRYDATFTDDAELTVDLQEGESIGGVLIFEVPEDIGEPTLNWNDRGVDLVVIGEESVQ